MNIEDRKRKIEHMERELLAMKKEVVLDVLGGGTVTQDIKGEAKDESKTVVKVGIQVEGEKDLEVEANCIVCLGITEVNDAKRGIGYSSDMVMVGNYSLDRVMAAIKGLQRAQNDLIKQALDTFGVEAMEEILNLSMK